MNEDSEFDPSEAIAALRQKFGGRPQTRGPKLSFFRRCSAYACLVFGVKPFEVAEIFHLSRSAVSFLAGCRDDTRGPVTMELGDFSTIRIDANLTRRRNPNRKPRYPDVAAEFDRLGEQEFLARYLTQDVYDRLMAIETIPTIHALGLKPSDPLPMKNQWEGEHQLDAVSTVLVAWVDDGWYWAGKQDRPVWTGKEEGSGKKRPFRTSRLAYDGAKKYCLGED